MKTLPRFVLRLLLAAPVPATLVFATTRASAAQPGWTDYVVKKGDTCASIALAIYGDQSRYDLVHEGNPDLGPQPHNLKEGRVLHLPPKPADAKLSAVRNLVDVNANPGQKNDPLFRGNRVATHPTAAAGIEFRDATELDLGENTLVVIFGDTAANASRTRTSADATLVTGRLRAHLGQLAGSATPTTHVIETPAGTASLGAGEAQVHVDETKATRLAVYQGRSSITAQKKVVKVDEGFGSKALEGKPPGNPRPLPPAPVWSTPFPALTLTADKAGADVAGTYAPGTGPGDAPAEWHVEVARDDAFKDIFVDTRVPRAVVQLAQQHVVPGVYFARVSAIDGDKFEGKYGPVARIQVAAVDVTPLPDHHARIDVAPHGLGCALGDAPLAPFDAPADFDRTDATRLRCAPSTDANAVALFDLPADRLGPLTVRTTWVPATSSPADVNTAEITIDVLDAGAAPVRKPKVVVTSTSPGVEVLAVRAGTGAGQWIAQVRWDARATALGIHVKASEIDEGDAASLPIVRPEHLHRWEASLGGGVAAADANPSRYAARGEIGAAMRSSLGPGSLLVGASVAFEYAPTAEDGASAIRAATVSFGIPITYRLGRGEPLVAPYLSVTPEILQQASSITNAANAHDGHATLLGAEGDLGVQVHLGAGALYLQAGFRGTGALNRDVRDEQPNAVVTTLGYRAFF